VYDSAASTPYQQQQQQWCIKAAMVARKVCRQACQHRWLVSSRTARIIVRKANPAKKQINKV
jgi:hypothetical protein